MPSYFLIREVMSLSVVNSGPVNAELVYNPETCRYTFAIQDYRVRVATRRAIAGKMIELDEALDETLDDLKILAVMTAVRVFVSAVILAALIQILVAEEIQMWITAGLLISITVFWLWRFKVQKMNIYKRLSEKQKMAELELALLLRKDLATARKRKAATKA